MTRVEKAGSSDNLPQIYIGISVLALLICVCIIGFVVWRCKMTCVFHADNILTLRIGFSVPVFVALYAMRHAICHAMRHAMQKLNRSWGPVIGALNFHSSYFLHLQGEEKKADDGRTSKKSRQRKGTKNYPAWISS